jgi:putative spermidine/putrescine transport system substrate-binding protein
MSGGSGLRRLGIMAGALVLLTACGGTSTSSTGTSAANAKSAADMGGMSALVDAAKKEGKLNVIALPPTWANYGKIISGFTAKYGIAVTSANPNGSSQQEIDAIKQLANTDRAPDVVDVGMKYAIANTTLFAPYQVATWKDIPTSQKETSGLWFQDYGGYMSVGYDSAKVPAPTSIADLLGSAYKSMVALAGDPTQSNQALNGVMMASIANGGSVTDVSKGVDFFHQLKQNKNFVPVIGTAATVKAGQTRVLFEWDYLSQSHVADVPTWKVFLPTNAVLGGYYAQAVNKQAPHPAAARLWQEYLYSDEGQNLYLKGGARPVRMDAMQKAGTLDAAAAAALPPVKGTPVFMSEEQSTAAGTYVASHWAQAIG